MEDLESHKLEELVSKGSEVMDGPMHVHIPEEQGAAEKTDGAELLALDMLRLGQQGEEAWDDFKFCLGLVAKKFCLGLCC